MAFLETGEIPFSPVDVKVNIYNKILSDKRMENECHLISFTDYLLVTFSSLTKDIKFSNMFPWYFCSPIFNCVLSPKTLYPTGLKSMNVTTGISAE